MHAHVTSVWVHFSDETCYIYSALSVAMVVKPRMLIMSFAGMILNVALVLSILILVCNIGGVLDWVVVVCMCVRYCLLFASGCYTLIYNNKYVNRCKYVFEIVL